MKVGIRKSHRKSHYPNLKQLLFEFGFGPCVCVCVCCLFRIVQLLLSLQAIVMSEYIYFNEPGYEGTAGTEEGEKFNTAYSNIVKLGNIRFAMIESMRNPLPEFKEII